MGTIILSALVAHTGWHWMLERWERLRQFRLPAINAALLASGMRRLILMLILAGLIWLGSGAVSRRRERRSNAETAQPQEKEDQVVL
jgi:hypothetical protein